ncbi:PepSY domain-containing protein [Defluviimonas sp. WL0002]|uniref:PepSY domain-containing protein n=1 Tax=Albidovulum marisflavi TaxID=2984159 RepID=A0ABT2ZF39_9RHOB|nr:PepSY domain-containing protein [Defluviimonas sp. WL0002]MCV2869706.1 PepSY domain-containing protein [Defluviimonas sp. WL0002]
MFRKLMLTSAFAAFSAAGVLASSTPALAITTEEVISGLQAQGYTNIEVKVGPSQIKAEASNGTDKLEVIFDKETGDVLKSEIYEGQGSDVDSGIEIENEGQDFLDDDDDDDRSGDDDDDDDDDSDDDDDDDDSDDDDDDDDNGGSGSGHDENDDHGGDDD